MTFFIVGFVLLVMTGSPIWGQDASSVTREQVVAQLQAEHVAQIARIVRLVAKGVLVTSDASMTPEQEAMITDISRQVVQDAELKLAEKRQYDDKKEARIELITSIVLTVAKGLAIVIALLVLRAIIGAMGKGVAAESADTPLGVMMTTRTGDDALKLSRALIGDALASGGTVTSHVRSIYRLGEDVYDRPEALVILKTTNGQLKELIHRAEGISSGAPEMIALSRSMFRTP